MSNAYDKSLRDLAWHCVQKRGMTDFVHKGGVYAMVSGPRLVHLLLIIGAHHRC
jgi:purine nucleoside phosphorylase